MNEKSRDAALKAEEIKTSPLPVPVPGENAVEVLVEINGPKGPEPTRYGDWEVGGRCSDF